jgi:hypothetical protein
MDVLGRWTVRSRSGSIAYPPDRHREARQRVQGCRRPDSFCEPTKGATPAPLHARVAGLASYTPSIRSSSAW